MYACRARWVAEGVTQAGITDCLSHIGNRDWVLEQCLSSLGPDAHSQAALLDYGLQETDVQLQHLRQPQSADLGQASGEAGQAWRETDLGWVTKRLRLLQQRERLATLQELCGGWGFMLCLSAVSLHTAGPNRCNAWVVCRDCAGSRSSELWLCLRDGSCSWLCRESEDSAASNGS